jgi:hypothetical protein
MAEKVTDMSATCRPDSQMSSHFSQMPLSRQHNFDPDTFFCVRICQHPPNFPLLYIPEVHKENSSVRFGQNICSISVRHGRSCSSPHQNLTSSQLPELFQHKAASIKQHLLPQHKLRNNIEPAHPYQSS